MKWYDTAYAVGVGFMLFGSIWVWIALVGALITRAMKCQ